MHRGEGTTGLNELRNPEDATIKPRLLSRQGAVGIEPVPGINNQHTSKAIGTRSNRRALLPRENGSGAYFVGSREVTRQCGARWSNAVREITAQRAEPSTMAHRGTHESVSKSAAMPSNIHNTLAALEQLRLGATAPS